MWSTAASPLLFLLGTIGAGAAVSACGDQCDLVERRCGDGRVIEECVFLGDGVPNRNVWSDQGARCIGDATCVDVEVDGLQGAACSLTGQPDVRCAAGQFGPRCLPDGVLVVCDQGYVSYEEVCAGACVPSATGPGAFCAARPDPAPACAGATGSECDGDLMVLCRDGYVTEEIACGDGASCVEDDAGFDAPIGYCVGPAACAGPSSVRCVDGRRMTGCMDGRVVDLTCPADTECSSYAALGGVRVASCEERH